MSSFCGKTIELIRVSASVVLPSHIFFLLLDAFLYKFSLIYFSALMNGLSPTLRCVRPPNAQRVHYTSNYFRQIECPHLLCAFTLCTWCYRRRRCSTEFNFARAIAKMLPLARECPVIYSTRTRVREVAFDHRSTDTTVAYQPNGIAHRSI